MTIDFSKLKELREAKGLTQTELAHKVGVSLAGYRLWETLGGQPGRANYEKLIAILEGDSEHE